MGLSSDLTLPEFSGARLNHQELKLLPEESSVIPNREVLRFLDGTEVEFSGRVKELRPHSTRKDLDSFCLVNNIVTPLPVGESILVDHLWILKKQFKKAGRIPNQNERVRFHGRVYSYRRLGGKSLDRGLYGLEDFGILPLRFKGS